MTGGDFVLNVGLGGAAITGLFIAGNYVNNWQVMPHSKKLKRNIACGFYAVSTLAFFIALYNLLPTLLAVLVSCVVVPVLGWTFYGGYRTAVDQIYAELRGHFYALFSRGKPAGILELDDPEFQELDELEKPDNDEQKALSLVKAKLKTFAPAPGPFSISYFDIVPRKDFYDMIILTQETALAGFITKGFDINKWKTIREFAHKFHPALRDLFSQEIPMGFSDEQRFRHQFIVGATGSGKTTLLSTQINEDLNRVARNEASLFVMDSQNELIPNIARLARFAPGGDMHGKLIYIEYDPDHPLSLNIFDFNRERLATLSSRERVTLVRGTEEMIGFFMQSFVKAETSGFMEAIVRYILRAVMHVPNATIFTFKDFLSKDGFAKHAEHLATISENDRRFLTADMFDGSYGASLGAMRARLAAMTSDDLFNSMFTHPRNMFDLFTLLQDSKVILVNTTKGVLKQATEPFGRYFIARLMQATEERMLIPRASRLPVFAYIDEAGDYISDEQNIAELIDKARKQKIALTLAIQRTGDIANANVLDALRRAAIQCWGRVQPKWNIAIDGAEPIEITVPPVDFGDMTRMSEEQFQTILADMRKRFSVSAEIVSPPSAPIQRARPGPAPVTEPDDDFPTGPAKY